MEKSLSIGQAALYLGISIVTLRRWNKASKISSFRTFGNHRRFRMSDLLKITHPQSSRLHVGYARVSTHGQKADLLKQIEILNQSIKNDHKMVISDLGSGLNYKKKGLTKLFSLILNNQIETLYLTHKDRLLRFGSELFFNICQHHGTKVIILNAVENKSFESTLAEDVIELMTVFSAKLYGKRSHRNKKQLVSDINLTS